MQLIHVLFESASGFALFRTMEYEEIGLFIPHVMKSVLDTSKFRSVVSLVAFYPFKSILEALDYMKNSVNGKLHEELRLFLQDNMPRSRDTKTPNVLGVQDEELASAITDELDIKCLTTGVVPELLRGIRFHFHKLVKGYKNLNIITKSQQGLAHHYSREKMNMHINKFDTMIVESLNTFDQLNLDIITMTSRLRKWFSTNFPELSTIVKDNESYVKCVEVIKIRKNINEGIVEKLDAILNDKQLVEQVLSSSQTSKGMDIATEDEENIQIFLKRILSTIQRRDELTIYLKEKMNTIAPSVSTLMGEMVGARLISQAGSLSGLAKLPASTVQVLGAEKSLFRTMKKKECSTKLLKAKGLLSRFLANKCALASRTDCFSLKPTKAFGEDLKNQVKQQQNFYETGKYGVDPEFEKRKAEAIAERKKALRKVRRERRRLKLIKKNDDSKVSENAAPLPNGNASEEGVVQSGDQIQKSPRKRKARLVVATDEAEGEENTELVTPRPKRIRKSVKKYTVGSVS